MPFGVVIFVLVDEKSRYNRKQNFTVKLNCHGIIFWCPASRVMPPNGPAVCFSKRYPTQHPVTIPVPADRRATKLSRCKPACLPVRRQSDRADTSQTGRVWRGFCKSRYKFCRSRACRGTSLIEAGILSRYRIFIRGTCTV